MAVSVHLATYSYSHICSFSKKEIECKIKLQLYLLIGKVFHDEKQMLSVYWRISVTAKHGLPLICLKKLTDVDRYALTDWAEAI